MTLGRFVEPKLLVPTLLSESQQGAIQELAHRLYRANRIGDAEGFSQTVLGREMSLPSPVERETAFAHARGNGVRSLALAVGLSQQGIPWPGRSECAHVVFLLAVPFAETQTYLCALAALSSLVRDEIAFTALKTCQRAEQMYAVLDCIHLVRLSHPIQVEAAV